MKKISFLIAILFMTSQLGAQDFEKKANEILKSVAEKTKSYKTIRVEFSYKMENKEQRINESKDGVILTKGNNYRLTIAGQTVICNNNTIWTHIADANEIQINSVGEDDDNLTPTKLLTTYSNNFKSKLIKEAPQGSITVQTIDLTPLKGKKYYKVRFLINKDKKQIMSFSLFDKNGTTYTYKINKFIVDQAIPDSKFQFNKSEFPGAEINDMR